MFIFKTFLPQETTALKPKTTICHVLAPTQPRNITIVDPKFQFGQGVVLGNPVTPMKVLNFVHNLKKYLIYFPLGLSIVILFNQFHKISTVIYSDFMIFQQFCFSLECCI